MRRSGIAVVFFIVLASFILACCPVFSATPQGVVGFAKPYNWLYGGWVASPRIPLIGDINSDGYADFLYTSPGATSIDCSLNGRGGKALRGSTPITNLPQGLVASCLGRFGGKSLDIAVLGDKGRLSKVINDGNATFTEAARVAYISEVKAPMWLVAVHTDAAKATDDIAVVSSDGRIRIFDAVSGMQISDLKLSSDITAIAAGDTNGDGFSEIAALSSKSAALYSLSGKKISTPRAPKRQQALAMGDTNADGKADLLCNGQVFLGPDLKSSVAIPGWQDFKKPVLGLLADVVGRGRADLIVQHQGPEYYGSFEADCNVYVSYLPSDVDFDADGLTNVEEAKLLTDPLDRDTDYDGLCDGWEVHGFAGMDLPGMGASPRHKDIFVTNLPTNNTPPDQIDKYMKDYVVPFFAKLPYKNLDGTQGFAIHYLMLDPIAAGVDVYTTHLPSRIGIWHWMAIGGMGGGGQSGQLADTGGTGMASWTHEFGHQLGLSHTGKWAAWSPTYTSLMNYTYSYGFDGSWNNIHFSTGEFSSVILNDSKLIERLPFPIEKLHFLSIGPYQFRMKADGPNATLIDWNWNGVFDKKPVRSNITYGYAVGGGERLQPSGTQPFNYNGPYELMTDYQASLVNHKGKLYMLTASRGPVEVDAPRPEAELVIQTYLGKRAWTKPISLASRVISDPAGVSDGTTFYAFYMTPDGVSYRFGQPDKLGEPVAIPDTKGMSVSAVNWKGTVYAFFFKDKDTNMTYRTVQGKTLGPIIDLGIKGTIPPGLAVDTKANQLLLGTASPLNNDPWRWQLFRFTWSIQSNSFKEVSHEWLGGDKAGWAGDLRPNLIFDASEEAGPQGRIYWIARGHGSKKNDPIGTFVARTIGYKDFNNGWMLWRYYDEWTNTRSGIGAAWFDNDIVLATTWASGTAGGDCGVFLGYNGTAISGVDMSDFDDIALMANYGIARSIGTFAVIPPVTK